MAGALGRAHAAHPPRVHEKAVAVESREKREGRSAWLARSGAPVRQGGGSREKKIVRGHFAVGVR